MIKYIVKRVLTLIPVIFAISLVIFGITKIMPGNPIDNVIVQNKIVREEDKQRVRRELTEAYGLNQPLPVQYVKWMGRMLKGDFGHSTTYHKPVNEVISAPLKNTVILNVFVILFSLVISILAGIRSAVKQGSVYDQFWQIFSLVGTSVPSFFIGILFIYIFALKLKIFPTGGMPSASITGGAYIIEWIRSLVLPTLTLTVLSLAGTIRYVRNAMIDVLNQDFIRTARAKGLSKKVIVYSHAFRNALIPVVTIVIGSIGSLFAGSVITETVFSWNGMGRILVTSLSSLDYDVITSLNLFFAVVYVLTNFITDISYAFVDPRVKLS